MPWTAADANRHTHKANTPVAKRQWAHIADSMLEAGKSEASAIRGANSVIAKRVWGGKKPKHALHRT